MSFDRTGDAAAIEAAEDRSLNLLLRRKRVRSEIFRLAVQPDIAQVEYLFEILDAGPRRPIVFLLRDTDARDAQLAAVDRLKAVGTGVHVVFFAGDAGANAASLPQTFDVYSYPEENAGVMLSLAAALAAK